MAENPVSSLVPSALLSKGESPLVLTATLKPVADIDRFQPAGFPEIGHVIYKAPRANGGVEHVCIVDSAASMANHLESVCMRGPHDPELVDDLKGMPYLRCVTDAADGTDKDRETVVTSLTEGHRIASTYFLGGKRSNGDKEPAAELFEKELAADFGLVLKESKKAHPPPAAWWKVFSTIFRLDPNSLVHGVLFPQWQIKIPRVLTAHLEAFGAGRVDRAGVKFDRIGKTTSGQPIFAVDEATAREIRATFVLDLALVRSFGRKEGEKSLGVTEKQKEFVIALALWKIGRLLGNPFRFRSGCHLQLVSLKHGDSPARIEVDIKKALTDTKFEASPVTDIYWPAEELYREASDETPKQETPDDVENETGTENEGDE